MVAGCVMLKKMGIAMNLVRCPWCMINPLMQQYHDEEWGVPLRKERGLFELLCLEGAQAGLSWLTILKRRVGYREVFHNFDPMLVSHIDQGLQRDLMKDQRIIRNRAKIRAFIGNAQVLVELRRSGLDFVEFLWSFVGGTTRHNGWKSGSEIPTETEESIAMSQELRALGFQFVGPKICYAFMQASGMVNDHLLSCYRYEQIESY